jgi:hypothetical protein
LQLEDAAAKASAVAVATASATASRHSTCMLSSGKCKLLEVTISVTGLSQGPCLSDTQLLDSAARFVHERSS